MSNYSNWLKEERERRGKTQEEIAQLCGLAGSTYSQVERGSREPSYELVVRIADGLGLTAGELVNCLKLAEIWNSPVIEDYHDSWWISRCRRWATGAPRETIEKAVALFELGVKMNTPK